MGLLKVALLQMVSCGNDQAANLQKGEAFCRQAALQGADIALFPEMWNIGYSFYRRADAGALENWQNQAIGPEDSFIKHFQALAKELNMAIALTYLEKWPGSPRNTVSIIDRHGEIVLTYAKTHTCDFGVEVACMPGEDFYVCSLDTVQGTVKIGAMICYDREFPESARILMLKGAEIILTPNACTMEDLRLSQFKTRAYENMVGVALANYAAPQQNGHSVAYHPVAYDTVDGVPNDILVIMAGRDEGIFTANFDMDKIRAYREREAWGNSYRKPRLYNMLTALEVEQPFIRKNARR
ncbi:MAG TPA: carbon-nitrogen hydrolase family protein [Chloroflexia bacterium]|nr:carbon-nitrogen hydrolase family protein [Chloroflexia bacterium]